jgi:CRP-like cAMP-binding protein
MAIVAFLKGILGASSLLLGAGLGILWQPQRALSAAIMAFGSGTLLAAIAFDITRRVHQEGGFLPLLVGFFVGGTLFTLVTRYIDSQGGFLRHPSSSRRYLYNQRQAATSDILDRLSHIEIMQNMTPSEVQAIVPMLQSRFADPGDVLCQEGEPGDSLYMILEGKAEVLKAQELITHLEAGEVFGEMALLTREPRSATVVACTPMALYELNRANFDAVVARCPSLASALSRMLARRLQATTKSEAEAKQQYKQWRQSVLNSTELFPPAPEHQQIMQQLAQSSAPLAILCGSLIDNIPESLVIGMTATDNHVGISFLLAVFISNFPEALSSSSGMKQAGTQSRQILGLWIGVVLLSGICAVLGSWFQASAPPMLMALVQAIAGGAILAMLASTMMPEAYELGGGSVNFSTISGFLLGFWVSSLT